MIHLLARTAVFSMIGILAAIPLYGQPAPAMESLKGSEKTFNLLLEAARKSDATQSLLIAMARHSRIGKGFTDAQLLDRLATDGAFSKVASAHIIVESIPRVEAATWARMASSLRKSPTPHEALVKEALRSFQVNTAIVKRKATIGILVNEKPSEYKVTMYEAAGSPARGRRGEPDPEPILLSITVFPDDIEPPDDKPMPVLRDGQIRMTFDSPGDVLKLYKEYSLFKQEVQEGEDVPEDEVVGGLCISTNGDISFSVSSERGEISFSSKGKIEVSMAERSITIPIRRKPMK